MFIVEKELVISVLRVNWKVVMLDVLFNRFFFFKICIVFLGIFICLESELIVIVFVGFNVVLKVK